ARSRAAPAPLRAVAAARQCTAAAGRAGPRDERLAVALAALAPRGSARRASFDTAADGSALPRCAAAVLAARRAAAPGARRCRDLDPGPARSPVGRRQR